MNWASEFLDLLRDIRALLYLVEVRAMAQGRGQVVDQFAPDVDAALAQARKRLGG